jgi:TRAP-type C4-dicarboxylate transport system permease small subunit
MKRIKSLAVLAGGVGLALFVPLTAAATTDYTNMFSGAQTEALAAVTAIVPIALVVFAAILGIRIGQRLFKQFAR